MSGMTQPWLRDPAWRGALDEQLADELARLRLLLRRQIDWLRHRSGRTPLGESGPPVVTDADALAALLGWDAAARADFDRASEHRRAIGSVEGTLRERSEAMVAAGTPFPIDGLAAAFGLDGFVRDTLVLALAPELDASIPRLYAYAQDDASARHATPALALELFSSDVGRADGGASNQVAFAFGPDGPLARLALVQRADGHPGGAATRPLRLDPRVAWYLRGVDDPGSFEGFALRHLEPAPIPVEFATSAASVAAALDRGAAGGRPPVVNLVGPDERSARALAGAIAARAGIQLHLLSMQEGAGHPDAADIVARLDRESALRRTGYLIEAGDDDPGILADVAENGGALMVVSSRHPVRITRPLITVTVPQQAPASRRVLWVQALGPVSAEVEGSLREVVHHFDLDPDSIARVAAAALGAARLRGEQLTERDIWQACRAFGRRRLGGLADRIDADFGWDDIVLPAAARAQLEEIAAQVRHRATVYEDWQFARRLPRGRGVTVLFAGPSGTGKTMAAEVLARELDLDLYRIDLAGVVNKYIGETEKNLRRIFAAAEESGAILFFDEADALFGKRTDVRDSHDRYANIEIDYLLQRMEAYTGLAILATNRKSALDRAFLRRLRFLVDFPFPAADLRLRIWQKVLPPSAPTARLDFGALARLDLTGGNIQSVAINAAFLAAADGRVITMDHLTHAAEREYTKLDKAASEAEFGALSGAVPS
jgi:ATPase family protein associated with various cellular activities (AAA)/winged helix domain-containing protein